MELFSKRPPVEKRLISFLTSVRHRGKLFVTTVTLFFGANISTKCDAVDEASINIRSPSEISDAANLQICIFCLVFVPFLNGSGEFALSFASITPP